jgi:hypothetical protein
MRLKLRPLVIQKIRQDHAIGKWLKLMIIVNKGSKGILDLLSKEEIINRFYWMISVST